MKTILEISKEIGITKSALQMCIAREPAKSMLAEHIHKKAVRNLKNTTKYVDEAGEQIIRKIYKHKLLALTPHVEYDAIVTELREKLQAATAHVDELLCENAQLKQKLHKKVERMGSDQHILIAKLEEQDKVIYELTVKLKNLEKIHADIQALRKAIRLKKF